MQIDENMSAKFSIKCGPTRCKMSGVLLQTKTYHSNRNRSSLHIDWEQSTEISDAYQEQETFWSAATWKFIAAHFACHLLVGCSIVSCSQVGMRQQYGLGNFLSRRYKPSLLNDTYYIRGQVCELSTSQEQCEREREQERGEREWVRVGWRKQMAQELKAVIIIFFFRNACHIINRMYVFSNQISHSCLLAYCCLTQCFLFNSHQGHRISPGIQLLPHAL